MFFALTGCCVICKGSQQQSDETPMVWVMLLYIYVLYSPDWHYRSTMPTVLFLYGTVFAILHSQFRFVVGFQLQLVFLAVLCLPRMYKYYIHTTEPPVRKLAHRYILFLVVGGMFWFADRFFCNQMSKLRVNPQGHALWHVLMGFNSYFGNTLLQYCRAEQLNWNPKVEYLLGILPYVKVQKGGYERKEQ
jgi:dihydroceramidase